MWPLDGPEAFWSRSLEVTSWIRGTNPWLEVAACYFHLHLMKKLCPLFSLKCLLPSLPTPLTCGFDYCNTLDFRLLLSSGWGGMQWSIGLWAAPAGSTLYPCCVVSCRQPHFDEATASLSIFGESPEYLISLNGKEVCVFHFFLLVLFSYQWLNKRHLKTSWLNVVIWKTRGVIQQGSEIHSRASRPRFSSSAWVVIEKPRLL